MKSIKRLITVVILAAITIIPSGSAYNTYKVPVTGIDKVNNIITVSRDNNLYSFYCIDPSEYYMNEHISITMDQNNSIVDAE